MTDGAQNERWREVVGYSGYEVSDQGRIRSWRVIGKGNKRRSDSPRLRKAVRNPRTGYMYVMLSVDGVLRLRQVHVMVLEAFVGFRPPKHETRHLDGDSTNNRLANLVWGTRIDQFNDQVRHGTDTRGARNGNAKLSIEQVRQIRAELIAGRTGVELTKLFGVSGATITRIKKGQRYTDGAG